MRYVAAYLLAVLGGNKSPSSTDIEKILGSVGIEVEADRLKKVISELNGKDVNDIMSQGKEKLASMPAGGGGGGVASSAAAPTGAPAAGGSPAKESKKEEKKDSDEGSDEDMGFGLFD